MRRALPSDLSLTVAVALVAALVYANATANGFVLDDRGIILENPLVREPSRAWRAFLEPYWPAAVGGGQYRPIGIVSFAIDWALVGDRPAWFHMVNVGWHVAATVLVMRLTLALAGAAAALAAGLLFAIHPVHVEAVANVVGRLELMTTTFGLATLILHRRRSPVAWLTFALAIGSKESALVIPLLGVLLDRIPGAPAPASRRLVVGYLVVALVWLAMAAMALGGGPVSTTSAVYAGLPLVSRWLTAFSVVPHHLRLLLAPASLSADYEPGVLLAASQVTPMVVAGGVIVMAVLGTIMATWRREPLMAVALAWVVVAIAPVSNTLIVTGVALAERTLYLASAGTAIVVGLLLSRLRGAAPVIAVAVLVLAGAVRTWTRTPSWRDSRSFAVQLLEDHPESYRGHWVAARVLQAAGDLAAAEREYAVARSIYAGDAALLREAAAVTAALGRGDDARRLQTSADSVVLARAR